MIIYLSAGAHPLCDPEYTLQDRACIMYSFFSFQAERPDAIQTKRFLRIYEARKKRLKKGKK